jgi:hypothetical protein
MVCRTPQRGVTVVDTGRSPNMRMGLIVAGILIAALGIAGFLGKINFNHDKEVLKVGDLSAKVEEEKTVPQWLGGVAVLVGAGLVVAGAMRK